MARWARAFLLALVGAPPLVLGAHRSAESSAGYVSPDNCFWSVPTEVRGNLAVRKHTAESPVQFAIKTTGQCPGKPTGAGFLLEDWMHLGHMQMSFAAFFSFLSTRPAGSHVSVVFEKQASNTKGHRRKAVLDTYFQPLLTLMTQYFNNTRQLKIHRLYPQANGHCYPTGSVTKRTCVYEPLIQFAGLCAAWFASSKVVSEWRRFLNQMVLVDVVTNARPTRPYRVLIYDRHSHDSRSLKYPHRVVNETKDHLQRLMGSDSVVVSYHQYPYPRNTGKPVYFAFNCNFFALPDLIIMVHGAAMSNLICARPQAMVIEVGWTNLSQYTPLVLQLGLHYCFSPVLIAEGLDGSFQQPVMPAALAVCLRCFACLKSINSSQCCQMSAPPQGVPLNSPPPPHAQ